MDRYNGNGWAFPRVSLSSAEKKMAIQPLSIIHCANALRPLATKYWELAVAMPLTDFIPFKRSRQSPILPRCYLAFNQLLTRANFVH